MSISPTSSSPASSSVSASYLQAPYNRPPYLPLTQPAQSASAEGASYDDFSPRGIPGGGQNSPDFNRLGNPVSAQAGPQTGQPAYLTMPPSSSQGQTPGQSSAPEGFPASQAIGGAQGVYSPFSAAPSPTGFPASSQPYAQQTLSYPSYLSPSPATQQPYSPYPQENARNSRSSDAPESPERSNASRPQSPRQTNPGQNSTEDSGFPSSQPSQRRSDNSQRRQPQRDGGDDSRSPERGGQSASPSNEAYAEQVGDKVGNQVSDFLKDNPDWAETLDQIDSREDIQKMLKDPDSPPNDFLRRLYDNRLYRWSAPVLRFIGRVVVMFLPQNVKEDAKTIIKWATSKPPEAGSGGSSSRRGSSFDRDSDYDGGRSSSGRSRRSDPFDDEPNSDFDRPGRSSRNESSSSDGGGLGDRVRDQVSSLGERSRKAWDDSEF